MAFTLVNHTFAQAASATSCTVSPGWTLAAGHLLVVGVSFNGTGQTSGVAVTDSAGNSYTVRSGTDNAAGTNNNAFWFLDSVISTGGPGVTVTAATTGGVGGLWSVDVLEYSFSGTLGRDATAAARSASPANPIAPGSLALSGSNRLVVAGGGLPLSTTFSTSTPGFAIEDSYSVSGSGTQKFAVIDATGQSGTVAPTITMTGPNNWAAAAASYYEIGAAATVPYWLLFRGLNAGLMDTP